MKLHSFTALFAIAAFFHGVCVPFAGAQTTNYFYTGTTINTAIYDGQSIVVDGCTVAVVGQHEFANVDIVTNGVMTCDNLEVDTNLTLAEGTMLTISGGSLLQVAGALTVETNASLICEGLNTGGQVAGQWVGVGVSIQAGSVTVAAGGTISADGQGYTGGQGPGAGASVLIGGGGSYGGSGGSGCLSVYWFEIGGGTYGSLLLPTDLGSGGGNGSAWYTQDTGGSGGGAIELSVAQNLVLDGTISAAGQCGPVVYAYGSPIISAGGGSGGSILIEANNLAGGGSIQAEGGSGNTGGGVWAGIGGGGGGRIAVYYTNCASLAVMTNSAANGANEGTPDLIGTPGDNPGTAVFLDPSVPNLGMNLWCSNSAVIAGTTNEFSYVTVHEGSSMAIGGGSFLVVDGALTLETNTSLICEGLNTGGQVSGQWAGVGVSIQAGSVTVAAGATISADGQGYSGGQGPGAGGDYLYYQWGYAAYADGGGGYGGVGGNPEGASGGGIYGSVLQPADLGSGGAIDGWGDVGGSGGGAVDLSVAQTLRLDGTITAGGVSCAAESGGSGGSILITANTLAGCGSIQADGGGAGYNNGWGVESGGAGGGGRIAVWLAQALTYPTNSLTANPGGSRDGSQAGSVLVAIKPAILHLLPQAEGGTYLNWAAFPFYSYQVQYCTDLNLCNWSDLGGVLSPTNYTWLTVSNAVAGDLQGYYRVKVLP